MPAGRGRGGRSLGRGAVGDSGRGRGAQDGMGVLAGGSGWGQVDRD